MPMTQQSDDRSAPRLIDPETPEDQLDDEALPDSEVVAEGTGKDSEASRPAPPATPITDAELNALLRDPSLRRAMTNVVKGRVRDAEVEDVVQVSLVALHKARARLPVEPKARRQYACAIARHQASAHYKRKEKDSPEVIGLQELLGKVAEDPGIARADHAEHLEKVVATVPEKHRSTVGCFFRHVLLGENLADMAREMGVEYTTLYKRVNALKRQLSTALKATGGLFLAVIVFAFAWRALRWEGQPAHEAPPEIHHEEPALLSGTPDAKAKAAELRGLAKRQCAAEQWERCVRTYEKAAALDPDGETEEVKAARGRAREGAGQ